MSRIQAIAARKQRLLRKMLIEHKLYVTRYGKNMTITTSSPVPNMST